MNNIKYTYKNMPIGGGGYVTGFGFDSSDPTLLYARTDIGGLYRFDRKANCWVSLADFVTEEDLSETYPAAVLSQNGVLYSACGQFEKNNKFCVSKNHGESFEYFNIPARIHGNFSGRGTGSRLAACKDTIYFASAMDGLLKSSDGGKSWDVCDVGGEKYMTLVWVSEDGKTVVAGTAGLDNKPSDLTRGKSLYVSYDSGKSFELMNQPQIGECSCSRLAGLVAHRLTFDGESLYITMNMTGMHGWKTELSYSCDAGGIIGGTVLKYKMNSDGRFDDYEIITPPCERPLIEGGIYPYGFGGICAEGSTLLLASICKHDDTVYRSYDKGKTWEAILDGLCGIRFNTPYMKPENNDGRNLIHWLSDIKINPHNHNEAWFNTGTGVFRCDNLQSDSPEFYDCCEGMEETVHINVYAVPSGDVRVIDILGDLGGFAFKDIDSNCGNTFADVSGSRYITCINADFADNDPSVVVTAARGNWTSTTKGGVIISYDGGVTFERPEMPFGLTERIDKLLFEIEKPNVDAGWVALSADSKSVVWCLAKGHKTLPSDSVVYSSDLCKTYGRARFFTKDKKEFDGRIKVMSDRVNPDIFYGFGSGGEFFVSHNKGAEFYHVDAGLPKADFGRIDSMDKTDIKADSGKSGVFYITARDRLCKLVYKNGQAEVTYLTNEKDRVNRVGLGLIQENADYLSSEKMLYISGWIDGEYGFYRSENDGKTWDRINESHQMFGEINAIDGDCRKFGLFYIGTGSRGILYGRPDIKQEEN